jgi:hypothetical protein
MGNGDVEATCLDLNPVALPGTHHQPVGAEQHFKVVLIACPMVDVDFHEGIV